jgi:WhiB family redox-sensing transcriptional regulator
MSRPAASWRDQALCLHQDPELFFPVGEQGPARAQIEQAKRVCFACPVRAPCLDWAVQNGIDNGVWGGQDEVERRKARRNRQPSRLRQKI